MAYLDDVFLNKQGIGVDKYKQVMEHKFWAKLDGSSKYIALDFQRFLECFVCKISNSKCDHNQMNQW
jgi:hypothetical protein